MKFLQLPVLTCIGCNSMDYYCIHWILFYLTVIIIGVDATETENYTELYTLLFSSIIFLPAITYWHSLLKDIKWNNILIKS